MGLATKQVNKHTGKESWPLITKRKRENEEKSKEQAEDVVRK